MPKKAARTQRTARGACLLLKSRNCNDDGNTTSRPPAEGTSFAETALKLGGKSADEARRTGAIDTADDQVEALFAPQYQTVNSPAHRAVWDRGVPVDCS